MFKSIETHEKFYKVILMDGTPRIIRRDVYWDSGYKSEQELFWINQVHAQLEQHHIPCMEIK